MSKMQAFFSMAQNIFERLATYENKSPNCPEVQNIVWEWQLYITEYFYQCDKQILSSLGKMYVTDLRFSDFINRFGNGDLAAFSVKLSKFFVPDKERKEMNANWIVCPVCANKTRDRIREDTILKNYLSTARNVNSRH